MDFLKQINKLLEFAQKYINELTDSSTDTKKGDYTRFTPEQLSHLLDVYTNTKHNVRSYKDLAEYGNKKYGLHKAEVTYYKNIVKSKTLEESLHV